MNAPLTKSQREGLHKLLGAEARLPRAKSVQRAGEIRGLAMDGLDAKAISALTGAKQASVRMVVARMRLSFGGKLRKGDASSSIGLLIKLADRERGLLAAEAARRGVGANTLAHWVLTELLRGDGVSKLLGDPED